MAVYSTIWSDDPAFNARVQVLDRRKLGVRGVARIIWQLTADDVVIINGALGADEWWRDILIAAVARRGMPGLRIVLTDATWEPRSTQAESRAGVLWWLSDRLNRRLVRGLATEQTIVCFLSRSEARGFLSATGLPPGRAVFTPFFVTVPDRSRPPVGVKVAGGSAKQPMQPYVFTGGNTLRNWSMLTEALGDCGVQVRVATRHTERPWPENFRVGPVPPGEFFDVAAGATVGVICLHPDIGRSAGQQTYLNLLRLGVPVVVNDARGVHHPLRRCFCSASAGARTRGEIVCGGGGAIGRRRPALRRGVDERALLSSATGRSCRVAEKV
jgi:hypothetical protein